ncbi:hypothetical protein OPAG_03403 [Rhodococcus opacus PD630]|nr:hypothetical protein Pd630_LPD03068 [Rhodococcus opacus PD630]EHI46600.1 hypothetical protein OPAG_03403 [Rhodococcus opacus PD630]
MGVYYRVSSSACDRPRKRPGACSGRRWRRIRTHGEAGDRDPRDSSAPSPPGRVEGRRERGRNRLDRAAVRRNPRWGSCDQAGSRTCPRVRWA